MLNSKKVNYVVLSRMLVAEFEYCVTDSIIYQLTNAMTIPYYCPSKKLIKRYFLANWYNVTAGEYAACSIGLLERYCANGGNKSIANIALNTFTRKLSSDHYDKIEHLINKYNANPFVTVSGNFLSAYDWAVMEAKRELVAMFSGYAHRFTRILPITPTGKERVYSFIKELCLCLLFVVVVYCIVVFCLTGHLPRLLLNAG